MPTHQHPQLQVDMTTNSNSRQKILQIGFASWQLILLYLIHHWLDRLRINLFKSLCVRHKSERVLFRLCSHATALHLQASNPSWGKCFERLPALATTPTTSPAPGWWHNWRRQLSAPARPCCPRCPVFPRWWNPSFVPWQCLDFKSPSPTTTMSSATPTSPTGWPRSSTTSPKIRHRRRLWNRHGPRKRSSPNVVQCKKTFM